jgi:hypothetical protein
LKVALFLAVLGVVIAGVVAGCSSSSASLVGGGGAGQNNQGNAKLDGGSCLRDEPGCPCAHEGMVIACGLEIVDVDAGHGMTKCNMGGQICSGGSWSVCETNSNDPALMT